MVVTTAASVGAFRFRIPATPPARHTVAWRLHRPGAASGDNLVSGSALLEVYDVDALTATAPVP